MKTNTYPCSRCHGKGEMPHFSNVIGGVCFKCGGSGTQKSKPASPMPKFAVSAVSKETGELVVSICYFRASNAENALQRAKIQLAGGNGYLPETAEVRAV